MIEQELKSRWMVVVKCNKKEERTRNIERRKEREIEEGEQDQKRGIEGGWVEVVKEYDVDGYVERIEEEQIGK